MDEYSGLGNLNGLDGLAAGGIPARLPRRNDVAAAPASVGVDMPSWSGEQVEASLRAFGSGDVRGGIEKSLSLAAAATGSGLTFRTSISPDVKVSLADFLAPAKPKPPGIAERITGWIMDIIRPEIIVQLPGKTLRIAPYGRAKPGQATKFLIGLGVAAGAIAYLGYWLATRNR